MDEAIEKTLDLVHKLAAPAAEEIGKMAALAIIPYRVQLGLRMLHKARHMVETSGINPNGMPLRLFLPIVDHASMEEDEDLQSRWAALLANAATYPKSIHPSYIEILRQLTPEDAQLLDKLFENCDPKRSRRVTPWGNLVTYAEREKRDAEGESPVEPFQNLIRLGLIEAEYEVDKRSNKVKFTRHGTGHIDPKLQSHYRFTDFAIRFVAACRAPREAAMQVPDPICDRAGNLAK